MRSLPLAVFLALGAYASARAEDAAPAAAPAGDAADAPKKTPPPPQKPRVGPTVDEADFKKHLGGGAFADEAWALYQDPAGWPKELVDGGWKNREQWSLAFNELKGEPEDGAQEGQRRMFFVSSKELFKQVLVSRKLDLEGAQSRASGATDGRCPDGSIPTDKGCAGASVEASASTATLAGSSTTVLGQLPASRASLNAAVPLPPDQKETDSKPVINEAFKTVLKGAALGGMAGALIGVGLIPLLGPVGIFVFALVGAAVMVATKKLSS